MAKDSVTADRRLYLAADGSLVEAGDPEAATLYATEGQEIPKDEAERLGYKAAAKQRPAAAEDDGEADTKQQARTADKQRRASANK